MNEQPLDKHKEPDFYIENGNYVFTAAFLLKRGYCCNNGCRHCPYKKLDEDKKPDNVDL
jgi:hypothetical protein